MYLFNTVCKSILTFYFIIETLLILRIKEKRNGHWKKNGTATRKCTQLHPTWLKIYWKTKWKMDTKFLKIAQNNDFWEEIYSKRKLKDPVLSQLRKKKRREKLFVWVCTIDKSDWLNTFVFIINSWKKNQVINWMCLIIYLFIFLFRCFSFNSGRAVLFSGNIVQDYIKHNRFTSRHFFWNICQWYS